MMTNAETDKPAADGQFAGDGADNTAPGVPARRGANLPFDEFLDDAFGLNLRALKTIKTTFVNPRAYFDAAEDPDWEDRYTPSLRLWLSLVAVVFFLQFIWGSADSPLMEGLRLQVDQLREMGVGLPEGDSAAVAQLWAKWYFTIYPVLNLFGYIALAAVWGLWGTRTSFTLRQRWIFGLLVPSTTISMMITVLTTITPYEMLGLYALFQFVVIISIEAMTAWRGPFAGLPAAGRAWRIALLVLAQTFISVSTALIAQLIAMFGIIAVNG